MYNVNDVIHLLESSHIKQAFEAEYPKLLQQVAELWGKLQQFNQEITSASNTLNLDGEDLVDNQETSAAGQFK